MCVIVAALADHPGVFVLPFAGSSQAMVMLCCGMLWCTTPQVTGSESAELATRLETQLRDARSQLAGAERQLVEARAEAAQLSIEAQEAKVGYPGWAQGLIDVTV